MCIGSTFHPINGALSARPHMLHRTEVFPLLALMWLIDWSLASSPHTHQHQKQSSQNYWQRVLARLESFAISEWCVFFPKRSPSPHNTQDICVYKINFFKNHNEELPFSSVSVIKNTSKKANVGEDLEKREAWSIVDGSINNYSCHGEEGGSSCQYRKLDSIWSGNPSTEYLSKAIKSVHQRPRLCYVYYSTICNNQEVETS